MAFQKATKRQAKLRLTLDGLAGTGKTFSALILAKVLGGKTALIDTEHGSASKYADRFDFDVLELDSFSPETYVKAMKDAADAGYDVLVIDSLSHAWSGKGGALELVDRLGSGGSKFSDGWRAVTPMHNNLIDAILAFPGHVITTMRMKAEYVVEKNEKGKSVPRKVGMAPVQRDGMEYEFDVVAELDHDGNVHVTKSRCPELSGTAGYMKWADVEKLGKTLKAWLGTGDVALPPKVAAIEALPKDDNPEVLDWFAHVRVGKDRTEKFKLLSDVPAQFKDAVVRLVREDNRNAANL